MAQHRYTGSGCGSGMFVIVVVMRHPAELPKQTDQGANGFVSTHGSNEFRVENILADMWLDRDKDGAIRMGCHDAGQEHHILQKSQPKAVNKNDRTCAGIFGIPTVGNTNEISDVE